MELIRYWWREARRWARWRRPLEIEEASNLKRIDETSWKVTGENPAWDVTPAGGIMPLGWYMLSLRERADDAHLVVKLCPDYGEGFEEDESFLMVAKSGATTKRICRFARMPKELRLVALDAPNTIKIEKLALNKVFRRFAIGHMIKKQYGRWNYPKAAEARRSGEFRERIWNIYDNYVCEKVRDSGTAFYHKWLARVEAWDAEAIEEELAAFGFKPLVSIVLPLGKTPPELVRRCIESVRKQSYVNWQLCIAGDGLANQAVAEIVADAASKESRIEVAPRSAGGHTTLASNRALSLAGGDYVALLEEDDELAEHALFEVVKALNEDEALDILYSDDDKIDQEGDRSDPHFKSDWNPELICSYDYVRHLCVYRRRLIERAGGFRESVDGARYYDLLLRCSALTTPERIRHIPKVLYHWRNHDGLVAKTGEVKNYDGSAGRKALEEHLVGTGLTAEVECMPESDMIYRVHYPLPRKPLVSLIIPTRDHVKMLATCVGSILSKTSYPNFEIVIVDNRSEEPETHAWFDEIQEDPRVRVLSYNHPFNYSAINNFGVAHARGEVVGLINNDVEVISPGWLDEMVSLVLRPRAGCVGAKLYYADSTIQHAGVILGLAGGCAGHAHRRFPRESDGYFHRLKVRQNLSAVTAACLLVKREVYEAVGGLDEVFEVIFNDVDFCLRVREAGYLNVFTPFAELFHFESKSRGDDRLKKRRRPANEGRNLRKRWGDRLRRDPYYNPNLTLTREDFSLDESRMLG